MASSDNLAPAFLGVFITGTIVAAALVSARFYVRSRIVHKIGADDWVVLASLILVVGSLSCAGVACHYGLGRHMDTLSKFDAKIALKMLWVAFQITPSAEATAKISITIMLMRVTTSKRWRIFFISLIVLFIMITIASLFSILMSCWPIELLWDSTYTGHCNVLERTVDIYIQGVMAAGYDLILAISPIFLLWNVQISPRSKMLLCGLLALGFFTCGAGIARTVFTPDSTKTDDPTYEIMNFLIWKCVELPLSIIVGCLPTLRPLFSKESYRVTKNSYGFTDASQRRYSHSQSTQRTYTASIEPMDLDGSPGAIRKTTEVHLSKQNPNDPILCECGRQIRPILCECGRQISHMKFEQV